jgi:predicted transglutaminase-like cysteine proteinase
MHINANYSNANRLDWMLNFGEMTKRNLMRWLVLILMLGVLLFSINAQALDFGRLKNQLFNASDKNADVIFSDWTKLIEQTRRSSETVALKQVNDFFNTHIGFGTDVEVWKKNDYWATPMQLMSIRRGDCEDYSIAKYFSLASIAIPEHKLRLMYVQATINNTYQQAHMVLAYYPNPDSDPLILDNLNKEILPASARKDLKPIYSLKRYETEGYNTDTHDAQVRIKEAMRKYRMSIWEDLIKRAQAEGFD